MLYDVPYGALTQLRAGTSPEGADWNGKVGIFRSGYFCPVLLMTQVSNSMGARWRSTQKCKQPGTLEGIMGVHGGADQGHLMDSAYWCMPFVSTLDILGILQAY
jgi:hypothetical protein